MTKALRWAADHDLRDVTLRMDSQLVVNQVSGTWQCNAPHLRRLRDRMQELARETEATLEWIPRAENRRADELTREAYREARRKAVA